MREQVERLEDDVDLTPHRIRVDARRRDVETVHHDPTFVERLQQVDAAQERRLPGAAGADQTDHVVIGDLEVDPAQHLELAEPLVHAVDPDCNAHTIAPACRFSR